MTQSTETVSLLPCPFCGGEASDEGHIRFSTPLHDAWWPGDVPITEAFYVNCVKCGAVSRSGIVGGYQTKAEAIERWNTRVSTNKDETIEKLREALEPFSRCSVGDEAIPDDARVQAKTCGLQFDTRKMAEMIDAGIPLQSPSYDLIVSFDGLRIGDFRRARDLITSTKKEG